ncbi:MAG: helix-turn-helix transcriptional regulator [Lachnospiraceae bacterium]|nr:helix-turn-helix transcriptional regulator [Lachnospiraceae bacterium]
MPYDNQITGRIIRQLRTKKGLTQEVVSGLSNIPRSHLAMIESGKISPKVDTLWRISEALGMRLSDLLRIVEEQTP